MIVLNYLIVPIYSLKPLYSTQPHKNVSTKLQVLMQLLLGGLVTDCENKVNI